MTQWTKALAMRGQQVQIPGTYVGMEAHTYNPSMGDRDRRIPGLTDQPG